MNPMHTPEPTRRFWQALWTALSATTLVALVACGGQGSSTPSGALPAGTTAATHPAEATIGPGASGSTSPSDATGGALPLPGAETAALISQYTEAVRADPTNAEALLVLGQAHYQHARETADPSEYARAEEAFDRVLALDEGSVEALIGKGSLALARHDFEAALSLGEQALALAPGVSRVYGVIGDAQIELGRYDDGVETIQTMVDLRPDLGSYSRVSYLRELHGQIDPAIEAMGSAVRAGGPATENTEYVRVVLGNLWFLKGDLARAEAAYASSLENSPGYAFALAGMARVRAAQGDLDAAIAALRQAADRVPLPEFLVALGETQEAAGRADEAAGTYQLLSDIEALFAANGVNTDLDLALFEADHGDAVRALALAEAAYDATPNIKAADALAWALYKNERFDEARTRAEEALKLGTKDPSFLYHAGEIAKAQADLDQARAWLTDSLAWNAGWSPLHAPRAAADLAALGGPVDSTPSP